MPFCRQKLLMLLSASLLFIACKKEEPGTSNDPVSGQWQTGWVDIEGQDFIDEQGRVLQLRGINQRVDGLFDVSFDDGRTANEIVPLITQEDIRQMAAYGFNFLRLPINWSGYEPEKDQINPAYIPRIREVVEWCREAGIYVQIDWHADAWSKEIGEDGAPYWTIYPRPAPEFEGPLDFSSLAIRRANPVVFKSYYHLVKNWYGLRDQFLEMWTDIIREFKDDPIIIGFEPLNEPTAYFGGAKESELMYFYEECARTMRELTDRHLLWLEPDAARNIFDQAPLPDKPFPDDKIVYCPHYYPNLILGAYYPTPQEWKTKTKKSFDRIAEEGRAWNAPVVINEWGSNPSTTEGKALVTAYRESMEERNIHGAYWLWKEPVPGTSGSDGTWGFFDHLGGADNWSLRTDAVNNFVVPYAMALPGRYSYHRFDPDTRKLTCRFTWNKTQTNPLIYIPDHWYPSGFKVLVNGIEANWNKDEYYRYGITWTPVNGESVLEIVPI